VSENRVRRRIFGPNREEEVAGGLRRLHKEELHKLYASSNIIRVIMSRRMREVELVEHIVDMRNAHKILVGKPERRRQHGRPRCDWEDNIRVDLRETEWKCVDWISLT
jgi:hypothetical protein